MSEKARRVTSEENQKFREAITQQFNFKLKKRGRPPKQEDEKCLTEEELNPFPMWM